MYLVVYVIHILAKYVETILNVKQTSGFSDCITIIVKLKQINIWIPV